MKYSMKFYIKIVAMKYSMKGKKSCEKIIKHVTNIVSWFANTFVEMNNPHHEVCRWRFYRSGCWRMLRRMLWKSLLKNVVKEFVEECCEECCERVCWRMLWRNVVKEFVECLFVEDVMKKCIIVCWISCKRKSTHSSCWNLLKYSMKSLLTNLLKLVEIFDEEFVDEFVETCWNIRWRVCDNVVKVCDE